MDSSMADLSDQVDSEYEEDGLNDEMWNEMNDVLQEDLMLQTTWKAETERIKTAIESDLRKGEIEKLKKLQENSSKEAQQKELEKKKIKPKPPGLRVFPHDPFLFFYSKILPVGLSKETCDNLKNLEIIEGSEFPLVTDPFQFVLQLCPETNSPLIQNKEDFKSICDYLFNAQVSSADENLRELYHKSLLDALSNYAFKSWQLSLEVIYSALVNLGADASLLLPLVFLEQTLNKEIKDEQKHGRLPNAKRLRKQKEKVGPDDIGFSKEDLSDLRKLNPEHDAILHQARLRCIKHLVKLVNHITSQYPDICCEILKRRNHELLGPLTFCHILGTVSTFEDLLTDYELQFDISMCLNTVFQSFPDKLWCSVDSRRAPVNKILSEVMFFVGEVSEDDLNAKSCLRPWSADEVPLFNQMCKMDHHHNMVYRLSCLPETRRGIEIQRTLAFMILQRLVDPRVVECVTPANASSVWNFLNHRREKIILVEQENYLALNVLKLIDVIVGNDPRVDFSGENVDSVKCLSDFLASFFRRAKAVQDSSVANDMLSVQEFFYQVSAKWVTFSREERSPKPLFRQQTLFQLDEKRKRNH